MSLSNYFVVRIFLSNQTFEPCIGFIISITENFPCIWLISRFLWFNIIDFILSLLRFLMSKFCTAENMKVVTTSRRNIFIVFA